MTEQHNLSNDSTLSYLFNKLKSAVVNKAGDTMIGKLFIRSPTIIEDAPNGDQYFDGLTLCDKNGQEIGSVQLFQWSGGGNGIALQTRRTVNGNTTWHKLNMYTDTNGDPHVSFQYPDAWKDALGLTVSTTTTISNIIVPASGITISDARYAQSGKVAMLYLSWSRSSTIHAYSDGNIDNVTIGTLVSGKRPAIYAATGTSFGDNGGPAFYRLESGGALIMGGIGGTGATRDVAAGTSFQCGITYILA